MILPAYCSPHLHWNSIFNFWYKFLHYIMEQISCLCSVRCWQYIHILHNNQQVTNYWYKLSYEFKKFLNAKMLAVMVPIYCECTYTVCVCHVACGDKIQKNVGWLACLWCLSLLCILLNSKYRCRVQVGLLRVVLLTGKWRFGKWKALYIYKFIEFLPNVCRMLRVCLRHELWYEVREKCGQRT